MDRSTLRTRGGAIRSRTSRTQRDSSRYSSYSSSLIEPSSALSNSSPSDDSLHDHLVKKRGLTSHSESLSSSSSQPTSRRKREKDDLDRKADELKLSVGTTPSGKRFIVPNTKSCMQVLFSGRPFAPALLNAFITLSILFSLTQPLPKWFYLAVFVFWRLAYNFGIGLILHFQSNKRSFVKSLTEAFSSYPSFRRFFDAIYRVDMGKDFSSEKYPDELNGWLAYRSIVDIILTNDFAAYGIFALANFEMPEVIGTWEICCYSIGVALCLFNIWAKMDAHRAVGNYAWYWGDFFFLVDVDLVFDGIFRMFPHPMYTVGYAFYYGAALLMRSYTVLYVSVIAHAFQLLFLVVVENPHIARTYAAPEPRKKKTLRRKIDPIEMAEKMLKEAKSDFKGIVMRGEKNLLKAKTFFREAKSDFNVIVQRGEKNLLKAKTFLKEKLAKLD